MATRSTHCAQCPTRSFHQAPSALSQLLGHRRACGRGSDRWGSTRWRRRSQALQTSFLACLRGSGWTASARPSHSCGGSSRCSRKVRHSPQTSKALPSSCLSYKVEVGLSLPFGPYPRSSSHSFPPSSSGCPRSSSPSFRKQSARATSRTSQDSCSSPSLVSPVRLPTAL